MASSDLRKTIDQWLEWDQCRKTRAEIEALDQAGDWKKLNELLLTRLAFGTAGLRGKMRAGFNGMNDLVIAQTAQGLSTYMAEQFSDNDRKIGGIVFGYDGRHNSKRFAELSANIFIRAGFKVYLYRRLVATPLVPYTIRHFNCLGGVMVTASHNPKDDNGYKVYWNNGAQIITPHDKNIQKTILSNLVPREGTWDTANLYEHELLMDPKEAIVDYVYKLRATVPQAVIDVNSQSNLRLVYSAMHGVGYPFINDTFAAIKLKPVIAVEEQRDADPEFPTVVFPNPEEGKSALELSIKKADSTGCTIILANDPDADRLALATKNTNTGKWKVYSGNEIGALLGWWAIHLYQQSNSEASLSNCYMLASTVSSKILKAFAQKHGFHFIETLTGFKWMGNESDELMKNGKTVLFAFEEAIGFMFSTNVLDKDGVSAACHLASMACYLEAKEKITFDEKLENIYKEYGFHYNISSYYFCYEPPVIKKIFEHLRNFKGEPKTYPFSILDGKYKIKHIRDLTNGVDTSQPNGKAILPVSASSQMITFTFENGLVITLRTSGTEPKIKYYAEMCAQPDQRDFDVLINTTNEMVSAIVQEFLQPNDNNLTPKAD
ncbi:PREDICTED: phosphoglucomutase-2 [Rhagoletis zephyria]|uniref:phosphoglucomutase-2 n=1 Tax=Rhagoletis zephyria TaxID=28612 RepID=UPI0008112E3A|nr:PREDICTED: phosphoglucomutase-2 [Rhagoletis zephyria]XP_017469127.1 PREDICTED: phosphoglucomutase-2 [Rhagoletis zephyria]XP_017469128.1 PREDICTED: phosphoglucomutase-2 [Rhagoletis zephyria]